MEEVTPSPIPKNVQPVTETQKGFDPVFEAADCPFTVPPNQVDGENVLCGFIVVPLEHSNSGGDTIKLSVVVFKSLNQPGRPDPILFLSGGPGEKTVASAAKLAELLAAFNTERDLVFFDQRGVGSSQPALECPEIVAARFDILDESDPAGAQRKIFNAALACRDRLVSEGHNLSAYNTTQNAADVDSIRKALEYSQVNLFGGSYGSQLAQAVLRDSPENIRSVIIDSTVPMEKSLLIDIPTTTVNASLHLMEACRADQACNTAFPDLEQVLYKTVDTLNADPIPVTLTNPLDRKQHKALLSGDMIFGNLVAFLYQTPAIPILPQAIYNVSNQDYDTMVNLSSIKLSTFDAISLGMYFSVLCAEDLVGKTPEDYLEVRAKVPASLAGLTDPQDLIEYGFFGICERWPVEKADAAIKKPVTSDIPALILEGEFDPIAPPEYGRMVAEHLSNSYFFEFPGVGHSVTLANECARSMALAFLDDPSREPDDSCRADLSIQFVLPIDLSDIPLEPVAIEAFGIQTVIPVGWTQVKPEYFISPDTTIELVILENTDEAPESFRQRWGANDAIGELETDGLYWTLYTVALPDNNIAGYTATAPSPNGFYLVLIITSPDKSEGLYDSVFLPILEGFRVE